MEEVSIEYKRTLTDGLFSFPWKSIRGRGEEVVSTKSGPKTESIIASDAMRINTGSSNVSSLVVDAAV